MSNPQGSENQDIEAARAYHRATQLSYINLRDKPPLYKSYPALKPISLPTGFSHPEAPALDAVAAGGQEWRALDLSTLAQLLFFSAGVIERRIVPAVGEVHFRPSASTGGASIRWRSTWCVAIFQGLP